MAMLGSFRTGSLKELEKAASTSAPTYMQASLKCGHGCTARAPEMLPKHKLASFQKL